MRSAGVQKTHDPSIPTASKPTLGILEAWTPPSNLAASLSAEVQRQGQPWELLSASRKPGHAGSLPGRHAREQKQLPGAQPSLVPTLHKNHAPKKTLMSSFFLIAL